MSQPGSSPSAAILRTFRAGDSPALAEAWTRAHPQDPIDTDRFRWLYVWDRNFDPDGLCLAEVDGAIVGAAYAVRRRVAQEGDDLEPTQGWIPFFFVVPEHQGHGIGDRLLRRSLGWLAERGAEQVDFASYTPNYYLPGLDVARYPAAHRLLGRLGFDTLYEAVAMHRSLVGYQLPDHLAERAQSLAEQGWVLGSPGPDDVVDLGEVAATFGPDWKRSIREAVVGGLPLDRIICARNAEGSLLGWGMCGTYEGVIDRFGPFGVVPSSRGTGLGELLLHLTMRRMVALGAHTAWFLWTSEDSPAGHLYRKTAFTITRRFTILRCTNPGSLS